MERGGVEPTHHLVPSCLFPLMMVGGSFPWRRQQGGVGFHAAASFLLVYSLQGWGAVSPASLMEGSMKTMRCSIRLFFFHSILLLM